MVNPPKPGPARPGKGKVFHTRMGTVLRLIMHQGDDPVTIFTIHRKSFYRILHNLQRPALKEVNSG